jgi:hypothetical protein
VVRGLQKLGYKIDNLAYWGDTLAEIVDRKDYIKVLKGGAAEAMILSGGGNDLLAGGRLREFLKLFDVNRPANDYLKNAFDGELKRIVGRYERILADVADLSAELGREFLVFGHGYDDPIPAKLIWLGEPMEFQGIVDPKLQRAIMKDVMGRVRVALKALAKEHDNFVFVDVRGVVGAKRWADELHPTKAAFDDIAAKFDAAISKRFAAA